MPRQRTHQNESLTLGNIIWFAALAFAGTWWVAPKVELFMMDPQERAAIETSVVYKGCNEVRALGKAPIYAGQPGYSINMDGDGDGIACEDRF